jgi:Tol biopolymer transport system component
MANKLEQITLPRKLSSVRQFMLIRFLIIVFVCLIICASALKTMAGGVCGARLEWSPNGENIVFSGMSGTIPTYIVPIDGQIHRSTYDASMRPVSDAIYTPCYIVWSPDSQSLFLGRDEDGVLADVFGRTLSDFRANSYTQIASHFYGWTATGAEIYFGSNRDGDMEIFVSELLGENLRQLTNNEANDRFITLSPDSTLLFFTSEQGGYEDLYIMDVNGDNIQRLTTNFSGYIPSSPLNPLYEWQWAPDNAQVMFQTHFISSEGETYLMNSDGSNLHSIPDGFLSPDWSQLAMVDSNRHLSISNLDGSNLRTISNHGVNNVVWLPDSTQLIFTTGDPANQTAFIVNDDGTELRQIATEIYYDMALSPDGAYLAFTHHEENKRNIFILEIQQNNLVNTSQANEEGFNFLGKWSPDGEYFLFESHHANTRSYIIIRSDGTNRVDLGSSVDCQAETLLLASDWSPDGNSLAFTILCDEGEGQYNVQIILANSDGSNPHLLGQVSASIGD